MIDTHVHLDAFEDVTSILAKARRAGISSVVAVGMDLDANRTLVRLVRSYPEQIHAAVGYHPWRIVADAVEETLEQILVETDAPAATVGHPTTPADLKLALEALSRLKAVPLTEVTAVTTRSARSFFNLSP